MNAQQLQNSGSLQSADALTLAARAGGALLVARQDHASLPAFASLAAGLGKTCTVVGSVLNDVRR